MIDEVEGTVGGPPLHQSSFITRPQPRMSPAAIPSEREILGEIHPERAIIRAL
jgi:hypothetical protein